MEVVVVGVGRMRLRFCDGEDARIERGGRPGGRGIYRGETAFHLVPEEIMVHTVESVGVLVEGFSSPFFLFLPLLRLLDLIQQG